MKRKTFLIIVFILSPSFLLANTTVDNRRIEEEKRQSLRSSEVIITQKESVSLAPAPSLDMEYFSELIQKKIAFRSDASKALVILMGVEDQYKDLDSQIIFLQENKFIPKKIIDKLDPHEPLSKGLAAYMFCTALDIKGGIHLRLFGMSERYALKELVYEGIMTSGDVREIVGGKELTLILGQAADFLSNKQGEISRKSESKNKSSNRK